MMLPFPCASCSTRLIELLLLNVIIELQNELWCCLFLLLPNALQEFEQGKRLCLICSWRNYKPMITKESCSACCSACCSETSQSPARPTTSHGHGTIIGFKWNIEFLLDWIELDFIEHEKFDLTSWIEVYRIELNSNELDWIEVGWV
jgi:hypothetical protein